MALIGSLMTTEMVTALPTETVAHAAQVMATNGVGAVLVVEEGRLQGIFSERDVLTRVVGEGLDAAQTQIAEVATPDPITLSADTHVRECSKLMRDKQIRHLPVEREGSPVGIISASDLFAFVSESLERVVDETQYAEALASGQDPYDHPGGSYDR